VDFNTGGETGPAGPAKDDGLTCYNCGLVCHILRNCPNRDLMKKLLEQAFVGNDAPIANSACPHKDKKRGGAPTSQKDSGQLIEETEASQETDSEAESKLESLSDLDSGAGKGKGSQ